MNYILKFLKTLYFYFLQLIIMTKKEKVQFVIDTLEELYPEVPIPLDHKDPFTLLIAVLMSAQSTDVRVNKITPLRVSEEKEELGLDISQHGEFL